MTADIFVSYNPLEILSLRVLQILILEIMQWEAIKEFLLYVPTTVDAGLYTYWFLVGTVDAPVLMFSPWFAHGYTIAQFQSILAPLFGKWAELGVIAEPSYYEYDTYLEARNLAFADEAVANNNTKSAGRLVPR